MNIINNQTAKILSTGANNIDDIYNTIELAGRTCYKSTDKIVEGSAKKFVDRMIKSGHTATLEHATIYMKIPVHIYNNGIPTYQKYVQNKYSDVNIIDNKYAYVTTNYRVIIENNWEDDLEYMCKYIKGKHEIRLTVVVVTNLQVSHEIVRHRGFSFCQESSRYCNYSKDKFDNSLNFIRPTFGKYENKELQETWEHIMEDVNKYYMKLAEYGCNAQECAQVLPKATKTELVITGTYSNWRHFFDLRKYCVTGAAHPQCRDIAEKIWNEFSKIGIEIPCSC